MRKSFISFFIAFVLSFSIANVSTYALGNSLKFVHLSDTHLTLTRQDTSFKSLGKSKGLLEDAISQINELQNLDFVFQTGDMVDFPRESDAIMYMGMMNNLKYPWYVSFGNHDLAVNGDLKRDRFLFLLNSHNKNFDFNTSYYSFKPKKGYKIIVLDAVDNSKITGNGIFTKEQLEWLDVELDKSSKKDVILIFLHHPILEPYPSHHHKILNTDEFYKVVDKYKNPICIFSGHYHATKITKEHNIVHVSTPALVTYPNAFRLINISNYRKKVIIDFYFKPTNLPEMKSTEKIRALIAGHCAGVEKDQNTTIIIDK